MRIAGRQGLAAFETEQNDKFSTLRNLTEYVVIVMVLNFGRLYNYTKIQEPRLERNDIVMRTWHVISIIAENKPHAPQKTHLQQ